MSLEINDSIVLPYDRQTVWNAIHDPEVLRHSIPGCEALDRDGDGGFEATVRTKLGPVAITFKGKVRFENVHEPDSLTLIGEGSGGVAGFAKGGAEISLHDHEEGTRLSYQVKSQVGGKIAQLGARLLVGTSKKLIAEFFTALKSKVGDAASIVDGAR